MIDQISDSALWNRLVEFVVELFATANAESMFRWMIIAWAIFAVVAIVGDRFSSLLLGRSRPRVQRPPLRARAWRWRRRPIPASYSALPVGAIGPRRPSNTSSIPLALPAAGASGRMVLVERRWLVNNDDTDEDFWADHADDALPLFGIENHSRLRRGEPPERFNPLTRKIERLERDETNGHLQWPFPDILLVDQEVDSPATIGHEFVVIPDSDDQQDPDAVDPDVQEDSEAATTADSTDSDDEEAGSAVDDESESELSSIGISS